MHKIADIIRRKGATAVAVSPDTKVIDALRMMAEKNIGSVMVMDGGEYLGIMSERDYSRKVILKGKNSTDTKVSEIMSTDLPSIRPEDLVNECMRIMTERNIRYMPVFDKDRLAGIISITDVVKETILMQQHTITQLENYIHSSL